MNSNQRIPTAVIGVGYLGKFHAQKYDMLAHSELVAVVDTNEENGRAIAKKYHVNWFRDYQSVIGKVEAVSIATPTTRHYDIARDMLQAGIHVLVEKPVTTRLEQADDLIALAEKKQLVLQVGHVERFNEVVLALDTLLKKPLFIEAHRLAPFKPRAIDVNVVLDLMTHDIDIILSIVPSKVLSVSASGTSVLSDSPDICNVRLQFEDGCVANVTASRISFKSERKMRIFQEKSYLSLDFQASLLKSYGLGQGEMFPGIPNIECHEQSFSNADALKAEIEDFLRCIRHGSRPRVSGEDGRRTLALAMEITDMITHHNRKNVS